MKAQGYAVEIEMYYATYSNVTDLALVVRLILMP